MNAQREADRAEMRQFIGEIRNLQKDLGLEQTEFEGFAPEEIVKEFEEKVQIIRYGTMTMF